MIYRFMPFYRNTYYCNANDFHITFHVNQLKTESSILSGSEAGEGTSQTFFARTKVNFFNL